MNEYETKAVYDRLEANQLRINKLEAQNKELCEALKAIKRVIVNPDTLHIVINYPAMPQVELGEMLDALLSKIEANK